MFDCNLLVMILFCVRCCCCYRKGKTFLCITVLKMSSILSGMFFISGTIDPVEGTAFDLNNSTEVASRIPDVPGDKGFDHNFAIGKPGWDKHMAR